MDENNYTPTPKGKGKARKDVIELSSTIGSAPPSSPPSLHGTPIASRPKKPPFDPNIRGSQPLFINLNITTFIEGGSMGSTPWSIDINDEFQPLYNDLWEVLYNAIVRDWEERRRLKVLEKCIRRK